MCGIYGRIGLRDDSLDERATMTLQHRGPDDAGLVVDPVGTGEWSVALGQTRLAIVDLSPAGHQPMLSDDGQLALVFNGEIYNFQSLRRELIEQGAVFRSTSDTEVVLRLYERDGQAMLPKLAGMFAIAIWDRRARTMLLARDPTGIKPLYYRIGDIDSWCPLSFASEMKAILCDPKVPRKPNFAALSGYLAYLYVPPPQTAFDGIMALEPGHQLSWHAGQTTLTRYHQYSVTPSHEFSTLKQGVRSLELLLKSVVAEHMVVDVPVGAFLSGGIDSAVLVALMAEHKRARGDREPLKTFTVGFQGEAGAVDESSAAAAIATSLGVSNRVIRADGRQMANRFGHIVDQFDEPFANPTTLLHDLLCESAREEVTVAIAGSGGDEAFAGYPRHRAALIYDGIRWIPEKLRRTLARGLADHLPRRADTSPTMQRILRFAASVEGDFPSIYRCWLTRLSPAELTELLADNRLPAAVGADPGNIERMMRAMPAMSTVQQAILADVQGFLPDNVLRDADRMSMRHGLELRVPFADSRVLEFGLRLPRSLQMKTLPALRSSSGPDATKRVLRHLAEQYLPATAVSAPKQGFVAPMGSWLRNELRDLLDQATLPATVERRGLVRPELVQQRVAEHLSGERDWTWLLWSLVVLEDWFRRRVDSVPTWSATGRGVVAHVPDQWAAAS